jgi:adenine-specific DNA-methyltransferase
MARAPKDKTGSRKTVETLIHEEASRKNIPTAEYQSVMEKEDQSPLRVAYERRNRDLDPQLVWRGKDEQDWSDLIVQAPPLYIQEKVHPKVLIDDLLKRTREQRDQVASEQPDLFADFNGIPEGVDRTDFYQHDQNWSNRMILGDSLQVMASLAEREGLRGKVQCIYIDPPYGIRFNSNFQWSTTSRDVKDGNIEHITREPEQVKAFRDTWRDGIHSYLTYLRDRLTVARDLLADSGSIFVQIGDENVHSVRAVMEEVFGAANFVSQIAFTTTSGAGSFAGSTNVIASIASHLIWFARDMGRIKYRELLIQKTFGGYVPSAYNRVELADGRRRGAKESERQGQLPPGAKLFALDNLVSQTTRIGRTTVFPVNFQGRSLSPKNGGWKTNSKGMGILLRASRVDATEERLGYVRYLDDFAGIRLGNVWTDVVSSFMSDKLYVVQTNARVIQRCFLMTTDPGDLVLDPTCGSGTAAHVAEQWGRRWITIDTSRVALALARARIMSARYAYYILADSPEGQRKEAEINRSLPSNQSTRGDIRQGFVYERVPHVTLKSIANNAEIDVIWERYQDALGSLAKQLNSVLGTAWEEWEIPRDADDKWPDEAAKLHSEWWELRIRLQKDIDASISSKADCEYLYDKPYDDSKKIRVAGPFTVESLSPHRVLAVDENDDLVQSGADSEPVGGDERDFVQMILENLRTAGVQQAHKDDKIDFISLVPWPGDLICAEGRYIEGAADSGKEKRAAIFIGPEFGTVSRPDLVEAAREAGDADFDVLVTCAFNYDARSADFNKLGRIPVLKARMNADLHMADDLKNTGKGNLFVIFGEPDIDIIHPDNANGKSGQIQVKVNGVDVFHPNTGEVRSDNADGIACWFIDTDYNEESFFVRQAYFLGAGDPYKALKTTLKAEINEEAWATLNSDTSRPFNRPTSGRIAVKVINHLGDEVMKVFKI